ncbi:MAG: hypothetical protein ACYTHJ_00650 [Planctomycetota bacterium]|jgi:hypothetical protein
MPARNVFLKIILWSLGIAAAGGVLVVLTRGQDVAWRIVGTGITTALACGIMIPVGMQVDRRQTRAAGLFGMGVVVVEYILSILLIWEVPNKVLGWAIVEEIMATMGLTGLGSLLILTMLLIWHRPYGELSGRIGIALLPMAFMSWLIAVWMPRRQGNWTTRDNWTETGFPILIFASLAVISLIGSRDKHPHHWRWCGVAAGAVASSMWLLHIWFGTGSDLGHVIFSGLLSLAVFVAHTNLTVRAPLVPGLEWVRNGTIVAAALTAGLVVLLVIDEVLYDIGAEFDVLVRFPAATAIVAGCGSLALVVLARLQRNIDLEPRSADLTRISVVCPRCSKKQMIDLGDSACAGCKLRIHVRVEEPRCPSCHYLLFGLTTNRCPECGASLDGEEVAAPPSVPRP